MLASHRVHRITDWFGLEGTFRGRPVLPPCSEQGYLQLDQAAQSPVQPGLGGFQGWGISHLSGQAAPGRSRTVPGWKSFSCSGVCWNTHLPKDGEPAPNRSRRSWPGITSRRAVLTHTLLRRGFSAKFFLFYPGSKNSWALFCWVGTNNFQWQLAHSKCTLQTISRSKSSSLLKPSANP